MSRGYQYNFSELGSAMHNVEERQRKAATMIAILKEHFGKRLSELSLINVGGSAGIIDEYLSRYCKRVVGVDIDEKAIALAKSNYQKDNLSFELGDALHLEYEDQSFDIAICSQVYEHVPDANKMMKEIYRILKPGGVCYFAAGNRIMWNEPHYNLPLLSVVPKPLADVYMKITKKGNEYYEKHLTYWGLKKLVSGFTCHDYTKKILLTPEKYHTSYMIRPGSVKSKIAPFITKHLYWLIPGYIWLLEKPREQ